MSIYDVFSGGNRPFDKEEWAAAKQAQRKEAYELIDNTCSEMMASGDSFRQYLNVQGRFDRYSVANAILVSAQMQRKGRNGISRQRSCSAVSLLPTLWRVSRSDTPNIAGSFLLPENRRKFQDKKGKAYEEL